MKTDTSEKGLEALIVGSMTGDGGWIAGNPQDYDRSYALDLVQLRAFVAATQPPLVEAFDLEKDSPTRRKFLARLQGEIAKRGVIDVLRHRVKHQAHSLELFYGTPTPGNTKAEERYAANRFSVTRQLRYSLDETINALDVGLFINGLPIATFELKNSLTKQTVTDAIEQYKRDRDPREPLFQFGRCIAHFAIDDAEVRLQGRGIVVLAIQQGLERWCRQSAKSGRPEVRLFLEGNSASREPYQHHRELRADRRGGRYENGPEEAGANLSTFSPARCRAEAPR